MLSRLLRLRNSMRTGVKRRMDYFVRRLAMSRRMVTDAYYGECDRHLPLWRRGMTLLLLCLAAKTGRAFSHRAQPQERLDHTRKTPLTHTESHTLRRPGYAALAKQILLHDVISFDIFDTLLFRPFDDPTAVFYLVGEKLHVPSFTRYRVLAEKQARQKAKERTGYNEVTLSDIYTQLQRYVACDIEKAMRIECETELSLLKANPYMKQVYQMALEMGKTLIAVSDMYLPGDVLRQALEQNGYTHFTRVFLSQECGFSKRSGKLFPFVKQEMGLDKRYLHLGDSPIADRVRPRRAGFTPCYYVNVNRAGNPHRCADLTALVGSAYRGIVNNRLYCGAYHETPFFEYGYAHAGLYVMGYCVWIHERVKEKGIEKLLFLSRDGDILQKAYALLYPEEQTEYLYWSRSAATRLTAGYFRNEFFLRYIKYKISRGITMTQMLGAMELPQMQPFLSNAGFTPDTVLTKENYEAIVSVFMAHWEKVEEAYAPGHRAARKVLEEKLRGVKSAAAVDVGWAASGVSALKVLVEDLWGLPCHIYGFVSGANYLHDQQVIEAPLLTGDIESYMFSQRNNRALRRRHRVGQLYSVFIEMMLASPSPSFLQYEETENGDVRLRFDCPETEGYESIRQMQTGILTFISDYKEAFKQYPYMLRVSGEDAYHVCRFIISQPDYFRRFFKDYPVNRAVGTFSHKMETLSTLMDREYQR